MNSRDRQNSSDRLRRKKRNRVGGLRDELSAAVRRFVTIDTISDLLGVCDRTVRRWIRTEKLASHKFDGLIRVAENDLRVFIVRARRAGVSLINPIQDTFYTAEEVAEALGASLRTVRRRIDSEVLVAHDFFGVIRVADSDLRDYCERCRRQ